VEQNQTKSTFRKSGAKYAFRKVEQNLPLEKVEPNN
jgi:hypothetical protein